MDNNAIADNFSLLAKLIDIHGDDTFKAKSYASAAFAIEKLPVQLNTLPLEKIQAISGIGKAISQKILVLLQTKQLPILQEYIDKTPPGLFDMMNIKGLGSKKIATIWKELGVESVGELLYACQENRLMLYKGFGAKTQQNIQEAIVFFLSHQGSYLFSQIEEYALQFTNSLRHDFPGYQFILIGDVNRHTEVSDTIEWITDTDILLLQNYFVGKGYEIEMQANLLRAKGEENIQLQLIIVPKEKLISQSFLHNASPAFIDAWKDKYGWDDEAIFEKEEDIFEKYSLSFVPPYLREEASILEKAETHTMPVVIQPKDIRGIIHSHSDWSDGGFSIAQMAEHAIQKGLEYLVISDHSQSAFYAKGLYPDRVKAQHQLIDELNDKYKPFKIFKSIESDILNDGSLDYPDNILSTFDLVIASVHSNLKMSEEKAMMRLMNAIENPYTTILGHMTGRLLLSRNGYPVNYETIIDACVKNKVVIELNAHPRRLDMDWRYINSAVEKGVLISINPDAHALDGFDDIRYGVLAAQKSGLTAKQNLSSFSLPEFEEFLRTKR